MSLVTRDAARPPAFSLSATAARVAIGAAFLSAFAQGAVLLICAAVGGSRGMVTVLHRAMPAYDVAAWWYPMRGVWGLAITLVEAATVVAAMVMSTSRSALRRRFGLVVMVAWGAYWALAIGRVAWFTRDGVDAVLAGMSLLALVCQGAVGARWWSEGPMAARRAA